MHLDGCQHAGLLSFHENCLIFPYTIFSFLFNQSTNPNYFVQFRPVLRGLSWLEPAFFEPEPEIEGRSCSTQHDKKNNKNFKLSQPRQKKICFTSFYPLTSLGCHQICETILNATFTPGAGAHSRSQPKRDTTLVLSNCFLYSPHMFPLLIKIVNSSQSRYLDCTFLN